VLLLLRLAWLLLLLFMAVEVTVADLVSVYGVLLLLLVVLMSASRIIT
jgi:hypothetical protein